MEDALLRQAVVARDADAAKFTSKYPDFSWSDTCDGLCREVFLQVFPEPIGTEWFNSPNGASLYDEPSCWSFHSVTRCSLEAGAMQAFFLVPKTRMPAAVDRGLQQSILLVRSIWPCLEAGRTLSGSKARAQALDGVSPESCAQRIVCSQLLDDKEWSQCRIQELCEDIEAALDAKGLLRQLLRGGQVSDDIHQIASEKSMDVFALAYLTGFFHFLRLCSEAHGEVAKAEATRRPSLGGQAFKADLPPRGGGGPATPTAFVCSACNSPFEYGEWGGRPSWRCVKNRRHRRAITPSDLDNPDRSSLIPNANRAWIEAQVKRSRQRPAKDEVSGKQGAAGGNKWSCGHTRNNGDSQCWTCYVPSRKRNESSRSSRSGKVTAGHRQQPPRDRCESGAGKKIDWAGVVVYGVAVLTFLFFILALIVKL